MSQTLPRTRIARSLPTAILLASSLMLGACNPGPHNRGLESVHQPVVQRVDYVFDARSDGNGGIDQSELSRISGWFDALELGYGDRVSIDDGGGYGNRSARTAIADMAARRGLLVSDTAPVTSGSIPSGHVRVVVSRATASVPGCPNWKDKSASDFIGGTSSNFGCATNANMAAMVANPEDLVRGQSGASDLRSATSSRAIKTYQTKEPTGAGGLKEETTGGQ